MTPAQVASFNAELSAFGLWRAVFSWRDDGAISGAMAVQSLKRAAPLVGWHGTLERVQVRGQGHWAVGVVGMDMDMSMGMVMGASVGVGEMAGVGRRRVGSVDPGCGVDVWGINRGGCDWFGDKLYVILWHTM